MIAGIVLVPLTLAVGLAVDYVRLTSVRSELQQAVDAAALAGARVVIGAPPNDAVVREDATRYFWANFRAAMVGAQISSGDPRVTVLEPQRDKVTVTASVEVPVIIMGAMASLRFGGSILSSTYRISADATAQKYQRGMEVVLALDTTASMANDSRLVNLKTAAGDLLDILYGAGNDTRGSVECAVNNGGNRECVTVYSLLVGVVPFVATVNVSPARGRHAHLPAIVEPTDLGAWRNLTPGNDVWKGCVMARPAPFEGASADATPSQSPFMPFFWAASPATVVWGGVTYIGPNPWNNSTSEAWRNFPTGNDNTNRLYDGWGSGRGDPGPNLGCGFPIMPLQPSKSIAKTHIDALSVGASNGTTATLGASWAWRLLSPDWRPWWEGGEWATYSGTDRVTTTTPLGSPRAYGTGTDKVVVLFTDGQNEMGNGTPDSVQSCCTNAYGDWATRPLGSAPVPELNARTVEVCQAIKAKGLKVFVVLLYPSPPTDVLNTFNQNGCASGPEYFFNTPTATDLRAIFRQIGAQLTNLRLTN